MAMRMYQEKKAGIAGIIIGIGPVQSFSGINGGLIIYYDPQL
ncbi:hypothetical protein BMS3Bbin05_00380 [bacterium BMS3Bbin05]|nr:hypothetical protein BMS3Bbin05_00380 [bacterium BMS3Bbin05]